MTRARRLVTPADWLAAGYNAVLALIWLALLGRTWYAPILLAAHAAAAAMPWLLVRAGDDLSPGVRWLREGYPLLWILPLWTELDFFVRRLLHASSYDWLIAPLDRLLFGGVHPDAVWMPAMHAVWFSELMHFAYFAYYPAMLLPLVYLSVAGNREAMRDAAFRVTLAYVACFLIYIVLPVDGPHALRTRFDGALTGGFFYRLVESAQESGDALGCSFPSSHVAGIVSLAYVAWRWLPRWSASVVTAAAVGVALSTVYTQNHYAIDSVAGITLALVLQTVIAPATLLRWRALRIAAVRLSAAHEPDPARAVGDDRA